jgi:hypothetical protein
MSTTQPGDWAGAHDRLFRHALDSLTASAIAEAERIVAESLARPAGEGDPADEQEATPGVLRPAAPERNLRRRKAHLRRQPWWQRWGR